MESAGKYLKGERELRNLPLETVARSTRIRTHYLQAIEDDRYELLPAPVYMKGFLVMYAKYLGLNPTDVVSRYQTHLDDLQHPKPVETAQPVQVKPGPKLEPKLETTPKPQPVPKPEYSSEDRHDSRSKKKKHKKDKFRENKPEVFRAGEVRLTEDKPKQDRPREEKKNGEKKPLPLVYAVVGLGIVLLIAFSIYTTSNNAGNKPVTGTRNSIASTRIPTPPPVETKDPSPVRVQVTEPSNGDNPVTVPDKVQKPTSVQASIAVPTPVTAPTSVQKPEPSPVKAKEPEKAPAAITTPSPVQQPLLVQAKTEAPKAQPVPPVKNETPKVEKTAAAVAPAPSAPSSGIEVIESGTGADVDKVNGRMTIIGKSSEFIANGQKVYFFTRFNTDTEKKVTHVWLCNGKETHRVEMTVKPQVWSVSSYASLLPNRVGDWKVEARDGDKVLASANVKVKPTPTSPEQEKKQ